MQKVDFNDTLSKRRTTKAMDENPWPCRNLPAGLIDGILSAAGEAPFHKPAAKEHRNGRLEGIQPWRCYHLDSTQCRNLRLQITESGDTTKTPKMLAVADYLIQVTWLPNPGQSAGANLFDPSIQNMEHIAAASAAIQNMLLAATARNIPNYWSSGGVLRSPATFEMMGIPAAEILLGSIFLFPGDLAGATVSPGGLRVSRSPVERWARAVQL